MNTSALLAKGVEGCLALLLLAFSTCAQLPCTTGSISGQWSQCGIMRSQTYDAPPPHINVDSLKKIFGYSGVSTGSTWKFGKDGHYSHEHAGIDGGRRGWYRVIENGCALKLNTRRRNPMRIMHLDDSCLILWFNNPQTAYLAVYRRSG